jgi:hypothetical protein
VARLDVLRDGNRVLVGSHGGIYKEREQAKQSNNPNNEMLCVHVDQVITEEMLSAARVFLTPNRKLTGALHFRPHTAAAAKFIVAVWG